MPAAARLGDKAQVDADAHGCPSCPHPATGPIVVGSPDVNINSKPAARLDDLGIHAVCCGPNNFTIAKGSPSVYVNGKPLARLGDKCTHCGGTGPIAEGSPDVLIDDGAGDAAVLAALLMEARKVALGKSAEHKKGTAKKAQDTHHGEHLVPTHEPAQHGAHGAKQHDAHAAAKKEKEKKQPEEKVSVQFSLHDAGDPTAKLNQASVEWIAYGKTHEAKTNAQGALTASLQGHKGGYFNLIVKTQGVSTAIEPPPPHTPHPPEPDAGSTDPSTGDVSVKELMEIMPAARKSDVERYVRPLNKAMREFQINSPRRQAAFLAQLALESGEFHYVEELASGAAYEGRKDLGNTHPGDGILFKGRGLIQITGRANYTNVGKALGVDLIANPRKLEEPGLACRSACYWYFKRGLNAYADAGRFHDICVAVNGGNYGYTQRVEYWKRAKKVLGNSKKPAAAPPPKGVKVHAEFSLHDADDPTVLLTDAEVEVTAYAKKHHGSTGKTGGYSQEIEVPQAGGTYTLVVKTQGVPPGLVLPPHVGKPPEPDAGGTQETKDDVTHHQLREIVPEAPDDMLKKIVGPLNKGMREFHINTPRRRAAFIAQVAEESDHFRTFTEYASGAEYENRGDLGNTHRGDGVRYKGRGLIQITGRTNYVNVGRALNVDLVDNPHLLEHAGLACRASCYWYWKRGLNHLADEGRFYDICVDVNGGTNGLSVRYEMWGRAKRVLGNSTK